MGKVMKANDLANKAKNIANNYKTLYVMGCFGAPMTAANKKRYTTNHAYNRQASRTKMINAASADTFGFDCVCLIKGILWGWNGNKNAIYGGAKYCSNGVPDIGANQMMTSTYCTNISTNFSNIQVGEILWTDGHVGIYIGNGLGVECTPAWKNKVQITAVGNIGAKSGYNTRKWKKHGKLIYVDYANTPAPQPTPTPKPTPTVKYFKKYTGKSTSIVDALIAIKEPYSFSYRRKIALANNIKLYIGTAKQNTTMLNLLKQGKLIKP